MALYDICLSASIPCRLAVSTFLRVAQSTADLAAQCRRGFGRKTQEMSSIKTHVDDRDRDRTRGLQILYEQVPPSVGPPLLEHVTLRTRCKSLLDCVNEFKDHLESNGHSLELRVHTCRGIEIETGHELAWYGLRRSGPFGWRGRTPSHCARRWR